MALSAIASCLLSPSSWWKKLKSCLCLLLLALTIGPLSSFAGTATKEPSTENPDVNGTSPQLANFGNLPLYFIANQGQLDPRVSYYVQGRDSFIYFTPEGISFIFMAPSSSSPKIHPANYPSASSTTPQAWVLKVDFIGANTNVHPQGEGLTTASFNYFMGKQEQWKSSVSAYTRVVYRELWPGIDLVYSGDAQRLKYTFKVKPGADPSLIRLAYWGANDAHLTNDGQLAVITPVQAFTEAKPYVYQEVDGKHVEVTTNYLLRSSAAPEQIEYGFQLGSYDPTFPLIIDPIIFVYSGFIGGSGNDRGRAIAVDGVGNAYITGETSSLPSSFPEVGGPFLIFSANTDVFVAKINPAGTALIYAGYLGSVGWDTGYGIAVDTLGNAYITGSADTQVATPFPVLIGPDLTSNGGGYDAFVAKVSPTGALLYSGYIGGSGSDQGYGIAVDSSSNAYITGETFSSEATFPDVVGPDASYNGGGDAFVAKVNAAGTALVYAGYIGGASSDIGYGIAVDRFNNAYITGKTFSNTSTLPGFPVLVGPDLTHNGGSDAFVAKVNAAGTALIYAGYIGGDAIDLGSGIAVDILGNAYVTGETRSSEVTFPKKVGPDLSYNGGGSDAFVAKVSLTGATLRYAGYIGGKGQDNGYAIAVDSGGNAYVTGRTETPTSVLPANFPVVVGPDLTYNGSDDAFITKVNAQGTNLLHSGYLGGSSPDVGYGVVVDRKGHAYVTGATSSNQTTFPVKTGPDLVHKGSADAFVTKLKAMLPTFLGVFSATTKSWTFDTNRNGTTELSAVFGAATDRPVPGDYNGDGNIDIAFWRPSTGLWSVDTNFDQASNLTAVLGASTDVPVPGDYDGNGSVDFAVWRPSTRTWLIDTNRNGTADLTVTFGASTDIPVPGDYNGDKKTDLAVWQPSTRTWRVDTNRDGTADLTVVFGTSSSNIPVQGDYNGDGKTDFAVWLKATGQWRIDTDRNGAADSTVTLGISTDIPVPADYNGDLKTDAAVWRPTTRTWLADFNRDGTVDLSRVYGASNTDQPLRPNGWILFSRGLLPQ